MVEPGRGVGAWYLPGRAGIGSGGALGLPAGRFSSRSEPPLTFSDAAHQLSRPGLYTGKTLDGLKLRTTHLVLTTTYFYKTNAERHSQSLEFGYGTGPLARAPARRPVPTRVVPAQRFPPSVTILETTTPGAGGGFYKANGHVVVVGPGLSATPVPPQGQALLSAPSPTTAITELSLRRAGLYITIQASSPTLALDAARQLQPVP